MHYSFHYVDNCSCTSLIISDSPVSSAVMMSAYDQTAHPQPLSVGSLANAPACSCNSDQVDGDNSTLIAQWTCTPSGIEPFAYYYSDS